MTNNVMPAPSNIKDYYYKKWDNFYCCYQSPYKNLGQQWPAFGGIHQWINFDMIVVPYDHIKFKSEYSQFTLEDHLEYASQSKMFVLIDKTVEHIHDENDFAQLYSNLKKYDLLDRCVVMDNTHNETMFKKHNVPHIYFPGYVFFYIWGQTIPKFIADPTYQFLCLNNYHKYHRLAVIYKLHEMNLLQRTSWSYRSTVHDTDEMHKILPTFDINKLPIKFPKFLDQNDTNFDQFANMESLYGNSMATIVTETDFLFNDTSFATEKSLNAIFQGTVPIFVSSPGTVNLLREQSIDVYDDMIDHSYDDEIDPAKRFEKITQTIEQVASWRIYKQIRSNLSVRTLRNQILLRDEQHWIDVADFYGNKFFNNNKISI